MLYVIVDVIVYDGRIVLEAQAAPPELKLCGKGFRRLKVAHAFDADIHTRCLRKIEAEVQKVAEGQDRELPPRVSLEDTLALVHLGFAIDVDSTNASASKCLGHHLRVFDRRAPDDVQFSTAPTNIIVHAIADDNALLLHVLTKRQTLS